MSAKQFVLDTSAIVAYMADEPDGTIVGELISHAKHGKSRLFVSFISGMEYLYPLWRKLGKEMAMYHYDKFGILPVEEVWADEALKVEAARIKATYSLSLADAWVAATAVLKRAVLVHKDSEFVPLKEELQIIDISKTKSLKAI